MLLRPSSRKDFLYIYILVSGANKRKKIQRAIVLNQWFLIFPTPGSPILKDIGLKAPCQRNLLSETETLSVEPF